MIIVAALFFAIALGSAFLWLEVCYPQQPPEDPMVHFLLVPSGDPPEYVPPQEVAEQYYSYVGHLKKGLIMRSWPSSASS